MTFRRCRHLSPTFFGIKSAAKLRTIVKIILTFKIVFENESRAVIVSMFSSRKVQFNLLM